jgi:uncharacterized membrane protein
MSDPQPRAPRRPRPLTVAIAVTALAGAGFSLYLTYLELWVIDAICQWCVASAVLMVLLAVLMTVRLLRHGAPAPRAA